MRLNIAPEIRWSSRGPGYFFEPAVGYDFTQYDLKNAAAVGLNTSSTPTRTLPYARVDAGLVFERDAGSQGQRTQTLEPRVVYSYVPYRNQDELPIFDTGLPDLNLTELFRTNRYVGRGPHRRCQPGGAGADHPAVRSRLGRAVPVGDHRPDPLFLDSAGGAAREPLLRIAGQTAGDACPGSIPWPCPDRRW